MIQSWMGITFDATRRGELPPAVGPGLEAGGGGEIIAAVGVGAGVAAGVKASTPVPSPSRVGDAPDPVR